MPWRLGMLAIPNLAKSLNHNFFRAYARRQAPRSIIINQPAPHFSPASPS